MVNHKKEEIMFIDQEKLKNDALIMSLRLLGEHPDTFSPDCQEVMARWRIELEKVLRGEVEI